MTTHVGYEKHGSNAQLLQWNSIEDGDHRDQRGRNQRASLHRLLVRTQGRPLSGSGADPLIEHLVPQCLTPQVI